MNFIVARLLAAAITLSVGAAVSGATDASPCPPATPMATPTSTYTVDGSMLPAIIVACRKLETERRENCGDDFVRNSDVIIDNSPEFPHSMAVVFRHKPRGRMDDSIIIMLKKPIDFQSQQ